ncbi:MAG: response regulator transcription factor [Arcobacter sp.]|nr:response regulator transcription factor [Arcobacter sp.]
MARVIFISSSLIFHSYWKNAFSKDTKPIILQQEEEIKDFDFSKDDIVFFDINNYEKYLSYAIHSKLICLDDSLDELKGYKLLKEGAKAYFYKKASIQELSELLKIVKNNKVWVYPKLMSFIIKNSTINFENKSNEKLESLTKKELEVAKLVSKGHTNKEIAEILNVTLRTIKAHISSCFSKLDLKDRVCLAMFIKDSFN